MVVFLVCGSLYAAPLDHDFALVPAASASPVEKAAGIREARARVIAAAEKYEHTPYRYGGLDKRGLDCSGLVYVSFRDALGTEVPRNTWGLYSWVEQIPIEEAVPGDLVFFNTTGSGSVSHVGIYVGDRSFIHAASDGPKTGVIYSSLDEQYWSRTYAGAGRVLPAGDEQDGEANYKTVPLKSVKPTESPAPTKKQRNHFFVLGFAAAPTWNLIYGDGEVFRGIAGQIRAGAAVKPLGQPMLFGLELRPEWDKALGVFRLPFTLSWGVSDKFRVFAGPVLSFGDASLTIDGTTRRYAGGTSWLGTAGITVAPVALTIAGIDFAPYAELAWQSYLSDNNKANFNADFGAGFRFSTGLRFTWKI